MQIIPGANIKLWYYDSFSLPSVAIGAAYDAATSGAFAVVGPGDSYTAVYSSLVTGSFNIPTCVVGAGSTKFADRASYPNVFRLVRGVDSTVVSVFRYIKAMGWSKIAFIHSGLETGNAHVDPAVRYAAQLGIEIKVQVSFNDDGAFAGEDSAIQSLKESNARIIFLAGGQDECTRLWLKAYEAGLVTPDFVWLTTNGQTFMCRWVSPSIFCLKVNVGSVTGVRRFGKTTIMHNLTATPDTPGPNINATLGPEIASNTGVLFAWIPNADEDSAIYRTYLENYDALFNRSADPIYSDEWDYSDEDWMWDCGMALFYGFGEFLTKNSLNASVLDTPNYSDSVFAPVKNLSIFNTSRIGMYGTYDFVNGDLVYQRQQIGTYDTHDVVADFDPYTNVTVTATKVIGTPVQPIDWNLTLYSENLVFFGGSTVVPLDHPLPQYLNPSWDSALGVTFALAAAILVASKVAVLVAVIRYRAATVLKRASWKSLVLILAGLVLGDVGVLLYIGSLSDAICIAQVFVLNIAFGLVFSNLLAKTWRVYKIFNNPYKMSKPIQDVDLMLFIAAVVAVEILISVVWVAASRPTAADIFVTASEATRTCVSPRGRIQVIMTGVSFGFNGALLVLTTILCYKTRNVASGYNEAKWIALSTYNIAAVFMLFLPLIFKDVMHTFGGYVFIFRSLLILLSTGTTEVFLFLPKIMEVIKPENETALLIKKMFESDQAGKGVSTDGTPFHNSEAAFEVVYGTIGRASSLIISGAPVLMFSSGGPLLTWARSRWQKCNVTVSPSHLVVQVVGGSERYKVFRTEAAVAKNLTQISDVLRSNDESSVLIGLITIHTDISSALSVSSIGTIATSDALVLKGYFNNRALRQANKESEILKDIEDLGNNPDVQMLSRLILHCPISPHECPAREKESQISGLEGDGMLSLKVLRRDHLWVKERHMHRSKQSRLRISCSNAIYAFHRRWLK
ncbi:hypothetical protein HDU90_008928 [Geranomyces variabilis]|nr:hypothetical protein HDU90_008928 [Geranomyces variabilis]